MYENPARHTCVSPGQKKKPVMAQKEIQISNEEPAPSAGVDNHTHIYLPWAPFRLRVCILLLMRMFAQCVWMSHPVIMVS